MKSAILLVTVLFSASALANGEYTIFTCTSGTRSGDVVSISGCVSGEGDGLIACGDDGVAYLTITKENWAGVPKMTPPVIETVRIPSSYFAFEWQEELFSLSMDDVIWGSVNLVFVGGENPKGPQQFDLETKTFNNSFKVVGCEFTPSPMN